MKFDIPPIAKSQRSGFLDESVLNFSTKLFQKPIFGYITAVLYNIFFLYYWYNRTSLFSIITFTILYFIIIKIIQIKFSQW